MRLALVVSVLAALCFAAPAQAGLLPGPCPTPVIGQPFLPWLDAMSYVPAPDGGLEAGGAGWALRGGAAVVAGNEPFHVGGAQDARSLALPSGASATTAPMCAGIDHPTLRFFARRASGPSSSLARLRVDALHDGGTLPVGVVTASGDWQPTLPLAIAGNLVPHLGSEQGAVAFRFTAVGGGFAIDDVYVDPYGRY